MITPDIEETARLILMDNPLGLTHFARQLRDEHTLSVGEVAELWVKYRGSDRLHPTHDVETGLRLRTGEAA